VRGISHERAGDWDAGDADFRRALDLEPEQPQVLNYLGYMFLEWGRNFDEALEMISRAVAARPEDGHIVDSLGWAYYRLGRYDEAVAPMERAAELLPQDPIVNDHLGDVYWAVGRKTEARFQWRRALSFGPEPEDADRIRRKLEQGLDAVLAAEGAPPIQVATDGG
jgi:Flp pilus assembly protein TadD